MSGSDRSYVGITWDHPRGYNALSEASRGLEKKDSPISVHWEKQSLEEFESRPIEDLCARYDLVVMDHPHLGAAVGRNCLQPLNDWLPGDRIKRIARTSIGSTFQSYYYEGKYWALPLDAATQVMALRLDLLGSRSIPITWDEVLQLANNLSVVLSVGGPHALVTFFSICVALGEPPTSLDPVNEYRLHIQCGRSGWARHEIGIAKTGRPRTGLPAITLRPLANCCHRFPFRFSYSDNSLPQKPRIRR